jgi:hypothetical protein
MVTLNGFHGFAGERFVVAKVKQPAQSVTGQLLPAKRIGRNKFTTTDVT